MLPAHRHKASRRPERKVSVYPTAHAYRVPNSLRGQIELLGEDDLMDSHVVFLFADPDSALSVGRYAFDELVVCVVCRVETSHQHILLNKASKDSLQSRAERVKDRAEQGQLKRTHDRWSTGTWPLFRRPQFFRTP